MATGTINFITWNVNGLKEQRDEKFRELQNADVVFLQETHIGEGDDHVLECNKDEWHMYFTKYTSSQRGTAILVRKTLDFEYISDDKDTCAGYIVLKCKLQGQLYTLVSIYNHQTDTKTLDKLSRYLQLMTTGLLVIGGDFNTVFNPFIDKKCNTNKLINNRNHGKLLPYVESFMKSLHLVDIWRRKNPVKQNYTFRQGSTSSRLDYFFIPEECLWRVRSCDIRDLERPDHQPLTLKINVPTDTFQKNLQIQSLSQLLSLKNHFEIDYYDVHVLLVLESSHALSEVDIVSAIHSLQVSDTPRPDGIPVSFYKEKIQDVIPYIRVLYDKIYRGTFNSFEKRFNESVKSPHDNSQHFFNVDYLIISTILSRRLEDFLETQSEGRIPTESMHVLITFKTLCTQKILCCIKNEIDGKNPTLCQDFLAVANLVRNAQDLSAQMDSLPCQGCPLTPVLITLALKRLASELFKDFKKSVFYIFKQSVIVCILPEDQDKADAIVTNSTYEEYDIVMLSNLDSDQPGQSTMYAVVTLLETNEVMVAASNWLYTDNTQCYWPPFRSAEKCTEAVRNRLEPLTAGKPWEMLDVLLHAEYDIYEEAIKKQEELVRAQKGIKRKRDASPEITPQLLLTTDMDKRNKAKQIIEEVNVKVQNRENTDHAMTKLKIHIVDTISKMEKMDKDNRRKATIGVFGRTGVGKSSLLNAVLEKSLLPSGGFGACTSVITQVEANLSDSNYTAEIEFISEEEWENEIASLETNEDGDNEMTDTIKERITAVFGADAEEKTLEELKRDDKYTDIDNVLSTRKKIISNQNVSDFTREVARYITNVESVESSGGWYWPLVKSITIRIPNCHELLEHIVLVDIPGTGDCNKIRDDLWRTKLKHCSSVWIVSDINRAVSERDPWQILDHCIEDLGGGGECNRINFICTKTDQINTKEYPAKSLTEEQITEPKVLKRKCILHRNNCAKEAVQKKLNAGNRDSKKRFITDVFTVSSKEYLKIENENPVLESTETEIPRLQNVLRSLNKNINRELTRDYINEAKGVLSLIKSVQLDTDENMTKAELRRTLENTLQMALKKLGCQFDSLYKILEECLSKGVKESVALCVKDIHDMLASVRPQNNRGFHKIFRAMCVRNGHYWPRNRVKPIDVNKCLSKHMYDNIDTEFELMFPVDDVKTEKSMQEQLDQFSIIQCSSKRPRDIENFIKTQETKLKASLSRDIVERKKEIYSSIQTTIQTKMIPAYNKAVAERGDGCFERMENIIKGTIEQLKPQMFNVAKEEALKNFNLLKVHIMKTLETQLKTSVERSLSQIKIPLLDVSREIQELERLSEQLSV